jgi:hypothetical protein
MFKALYSGGRPQLYRLGILLGSEGIVAGECSCPVGGGGHCRKATVEIKVAELRGKKQRGLRRTCWRFGFDMHKKATI